MKAEARFTVSGEPVGKGRPRFSRRGEFVKTYSPEKTVNYETLVRLEYERQCEGVFFEKGIPLRMEITAYYAIPKSASNKKRLMMLDDQIRPTKKPDSSNVLKAIEDALNAVAYHDDAQIVETVIKRCYADFPRVVVIITQLT